MSFAIENREISGRHGSFIAGVRVRPDYRLQRESTALRV